MINAVIIGSGSYIPEQEVDNHQFIENPFCSNDGKRIPSANTDVIEKFQAITGIRTRRYVSEGQTCSEIATIAADNCIQDAGIDPESIDMIIVAHNFGDVSKGSIQTDIVPSLASRVKHNLSIKNELCVAYDLIFGCPGWLQGMIQASIFIKAGEAKRILVIGAEVLSRVVDPFDRDTMIFADGAGATLLEAKEEANKRGVQGHLAVTHAQEERHFLNVGTSFNKFTDDKTKYIKMDGHKIYQFALTQVPKAIKQCLDKYSISIEAVNKVLIHQANEKMDEAIIKRLFKLYGLRDVPNAIMPMIIERLGNSSVATIPTLYDLIQKGELNGHEFKKNDTIVFASVGAGMNINCMVYKF